MITLALHSFGCSKRFQFCTDAKAAAGGGEGVVPWRPFESSPCQAPKRLNLSSRPAGTARPFQPTRLRKARLSHIPNGRIILSSARKEHESPAGQLHETLQSSEAQWKLMQEAATLCSCKNSSLHNVRTHIYLRIDSPFFSAIALFQNGLLQLECRGFMSNHLNRRFPMKNPSHLDVPLKAWGPCPNWRR